MGGTDSSCWRRFYHQWSNITDATNMAENKTEGFTQCCVKATRASPTQWLYDICTNPEKCTASCQPVQFQIRKEIKAPFYWQAAGVAPRPQRVPLANTRFAFILVVRASPCLLDESGLLPPEKLFNSSFFDANLFLRVGYLLSFMRQHPTRRRHTGSVFLAGTNGIPTEVKRWYLPDHHAAIDDHGL